MDIVPLPLSFSSFIFLVTDAKLETVFFETGYNVRCKGEKSGCINSRPATETVREREREKERIKDGKSRSDDKFKFAKVRNFAIAVEESIVEESFERLKTTSIKLNREPNFGDAFAPLYFHRERKVAFHPRHRINSNKLAPLLVYRDSSSANELLSKRDRIFLSIFSPDSSNVAIHGLAPAARSLSLDRIPRQTTRGPPFPPSSWRDSLSFDEEEEEREGGRERKTTKAWRARI